MPGIKEDSNDSEIEDGDQETPESEKSSQNDTDSVSDGSVSGDDDSSEMDEEECERRRTECLYDMADLERQFTVLRDQLFRERITQVEYKLEEVRIHRAIEYLHPLEELQGNMKNRIQVAGVLREFRILNLNCKYEAEQLASQQNFENDKLLLVDTIQSEVEEKIRRLEDDRHNTDITSDLLNEQVKMKKSRRKTDPLNPERKKRPVTVSDILFNQLISNYFEFYRSLESHCALTVHIY
ncbi:hypothetical protein CHUAL_010507 [Chamberlinius hualienensis]